MSTATLLRAPQAGHPPLLTPAERQVFLQETLDHLSGNAQGGLIHRCYLTPAALEYGGKFSSAPANYMKPAEIGVIPTAARSISQQFSHAHGIIGIENGPGMESAMRTKSIPFFSNLEGLHTWVGRDLSPASIAIMPQIMGEGLPNVRIIPNLADFQEAAFPPDLGQGRKVIAEFGMTRGNMAGFPEDSFPYHVIKADFLRHRSRMREGDIYTFPFDCNQNGAEVEAAYNSEWTTLWGRELLKAMKSELPFEGDFDPEGYDFRCIWYGQSHGGFNYMMANRKMEFALAGRPFVKFRGDGIGITNSYKMPEEIADQLAPDTSFKIQWNYGEDRRVPMPTFCAV